MGFGTTIGGRSRPFATRTLLGWMIQGPTHRSSKIVLSISACAEQVSLTGCFERLYDNEFSDLSTEGVTRSRDEQKALCIVGNSSLVDGHFHVPLPWKNTGTCLVNNYLLAEKRLNYLRRRFQKDQSLFQRYVKVMQHHFDAGYIEDIPTNVPRPSNVWYMPHHPVFNPKKPDKCRIVFDCAAKYRDLSLNDMLLQGPNLTTNLIEVLLRFRLYPYAAAADTKKCFFEMAHPKWTAMHLGYCGGLITI